MARIALFDIDGTLVDSVHFHARAWQEALAHFGKQVGFEEVRSQIGKGGDQLLPVFLSEDELERFGDDLTEYRGALFRREYLPQVKAFPHARELLASLKRSGTLIGLASSCSREELGYYLRLVGGAAFVDAVSTADEAERSKPHPDVFQIVMEKLEAEAGECVAVGDSPYDAESAARAGVGTVGVLSGGFEERELRQAGCIAVYQDVGDLLTHLETSPLAPPVRSPSPHR